MGCRHNSEWPRLVEIARIKDLDYDQTILLLALREVENGIEGQEFNRLEALWNDLESQAKATCDFIKIQDKQYQKYLLRTEDKNEVFDFIEYAYKKSSEIKRYIKIIKQEFETNPKEKS